MVITVIVTAKIREPPYCTKSFICIISYVSTVAAWSIITLPLTEEETEAENG